MHLSKWLAAPVFASVCSLAAFADPALEFGVKYAPSTDLSSAPWCDGEPPKQLENHCLSLRIRLTFNEKGEVDGFEIIKPEKAPVGPSVFWEGASLDSITTKTGKPPRLGEAPFEKLPRDTKGVEIETEAFYRYPVIDRTDRTVDSPIFSAVFDVPKDVNTGKTGDPSTYQGLVRVVFSF